MNQNDGMGTISMMEAAGFKKARTPVHVFVDTETTGLGHASKHEIRADAIVEFGLAFRLGTDIYSKSWICRPDAKYLENGWADEALSVSHIPLEEIRNAPGDYDIAIAVKRYICGIHDLTGIPVLLHSYNIAFDKVFLEKRPWNFDYEWGEDPMLLATPILNIKGADGRIRWPRLEAAMDYFHIDRQGDAHRAASDAIAALEVYEQCKEREKKGIMRDKNE